MGLAFQRSGQFKCSVTDLQNVEAEKAIRDIMAQHPHFTGAEIDV